MTLPTVYLETTIPSYLAAHPSRDLVFAAHQQITHEWWLTAAERFELVISEFVVEEISKGDPDAASRRLEVVDGSEILTFNDDVRELEQEYDQRLGLAGRGKVDLVHIAYAVSYEVDYLVTWNCKHIANGEMIRRLREANAELGRQTPLIVTPVELSNPLDEKEP